jgi:hypothetical protein
MLQVIFLKILNQSLYPGNAKQSCFADDAVVWISKNC